MKSIIDGPLSEEEEVKLFKKGYTKKWACRCPKCFVRNIEDTFNDAIIGKGKTVLETWHKKDCLFIIGRVNTMFNAYPVYVRQ